ncbi:hypothetical protein MTsPCn9_31770 [Croceitalea sp. MTPC9]|uniref:hypothetical protein n=1 Tax=unclassified Croceitalea TaxID=2632280 RepID=UPI002B37F5E5|nr:hypothetical protein MTsPCn6_16850 [Croceitalea sp. MTPC6]GMN18237.1 hypothetical protein MTsPCn9_31770 [Croceitalea sp. MTPC9]
MENSRLGTRILMETERLILDSCSKSVISKKSKELHSAILKKYYNAADVIIDYHRRRVNMDVVICDKEYDPKKVNLVITTLPVNLSFKDICLLLKSCLEKDVKSLAFYARLLRDYANKDTTYMAI